MLPTTLLLALLAIGEHRYALVVLPRAGAIATLADAVQIKLAALAQKSGIALTVLTDGREAVAACKSDVVCLGSVAHKADAGALVLARGGLTGVSPDR